MKRFPQLQTSIASLRNTMITGVAGPGIAAECLAAEEEPTEFVTCPSGNAPAGGVMSPGGAAGPAGPPAAPQQAALSGATDAEVVAQPASGAAAMALGPVAVVAAVAAALVA